MKKVELASEEDANLAAKVLLKLGGDAMARGSALLFDRVEIPHWIPHRKADWEISDDDRFVFCTHWG